jgi:alkanesulfonate monooxygenase SsuD/methylene tetrahydromethanopterin reductase-like flavin-dependent oxidoreductase (luciferase family)
VLTFDGEFDHVDRAGLNPLPLRRDIPIWMGGSTPRTLARIGRLADGWFPLLLRPDATVAGIEQIGAAASEADRDPSKIGVMCMVTETGNLEKQVEMAKRYEAAGATHLVLATQSDPSLTRLEQHVEAFSRFAAALRSA